MTLRYKTKRTLRTGVYHVFVASISFAMIYPLIWMVFSSLKDNSEIFQNMQTLLPTQWVFGNYPKGWKGFAGISFSTFFKNSFVIAGIATIGAVISSALVAYGFARCRFKGHNFLFSLMLISMMLPFQVIMIPQFIIFQRLNWIGTYLPLIVPYFFGLPFGIFLNVQFIQGIPRELDEAAKIDGSSIYGIFIRIIVPLIIPAMVTTAIFSFIWRWDDFLAALLFLNRPERYTVSLALKMFSDPSSQSDWGSMFAMATLSLLPLFLIFVLLQKYLVEGISTSGLKG